MLDLGYQNCYHLKSNSAIYLMIFLNQLEQNIHLVFWAMNSSK